MTYAATILDEPRAFTEVCAFCGGTAGPDPFSTPATTETPAEKACVACAAQHLRDEQ
jgi:hypothetical protein